MSRRIALVVHEAVEVEHRSAVEHYAARDPVVARRFSESLQHAFERICESPRSYPRVFAGDSAGRVHLFALRIGS